MAVWQFNVGLLPLSWIEGAFWGRGFRTCGGVARL
jgi:hypothetical protein